MLDYYDKAEFEVGIDEAGVGTLVGSLYVGAVILPPSCPEGTDKLWNQIKDSKKLSREKREDLAKYIKEIATEWVVLPVSNEEVDQVNILESRLRGYHRAMDKLIFEPTLILVDGNKMRQYRTTPHHCIIKGDDKYRSIAAASILAKVEKDREMQKLHHLYPQYNWIRNCGYLTEEHKKKIEEFGITSFHRKTYGICKKYGDSSGNNS